MQAYLIRTLYEAAHLLGYEVWTEQRVRTQQNRPAIAFQIFVSPNGEPAEDVFTEPPYLCVEILSPDDTAVDMRAEVHEYLAFGVAYVWIVDPTNGSSSQTEIASLQRVLTTPEQPGCGYHI